MIPVTATGSGLLRTALLALALSIPVVATAAPQITVSIKPLQLIAAAISDGVTTPAAVWAQGQDPHHAALRPSERRQLAAADIMLWTGPMLERPLAELVGELDARVLTVQDLNGLTLIEIDGQPDPHVWADSRNARVIARALAAALVEVDKTNASRYRANLAQFEVSLDTLDADLEQLFAGRQQRPWSVYHHALRYFEREFGLLPPVTLADSENNAPGLRTAVQVREQLQQEQITCMLAEPGVNHDDVLTMLDLPALRLIDADVMGRGADAVDYPGYMRGLAATLSECLGSAQ
jgi:zinc transport system substrate-binding protein